MKSFIKVIYRGFNAGLYTSILLSTAFTSNVTYANEYDAIITLPPAEKYSLPVSAMIEKVNVSAGQKIDKGDEIIVLDQAPFMTVQKREKARVVISESQLKEAQRDLEHHHELYDRTVLSTVDLENVEMREKRARAQLDETKAKLDTANYKLAHSKLKAPYDAIVVSVHVNKGQYLNNTNHAQPLVTLTKRGHYIVRFEVSAGELDKLEVGGSVKVMSNGESYSAKISTISYQPAEQDSAARKKYSVTAEFSSDGKKLLLEQPATIQVD